MSYSISRATNRCPDTYFIENTITKLTDVFVENLGGIENLELIYKAKRIRSLYLNG